MGSEALYHLTSHMGHTPRITGGRCRDQTTVCSVDRVVHTESPEGNSHARKHQTFLNSSCFTRRFYNLISTVHVTPLFIGELVCSGEQSGYFPGGSSITCCPGNGVSSSALLDHVRLRFRWRTYN